MTRIPGYSSTYSRAMYRQIPGYPLRARRTYGVTLEDDHGRRFIDFWSSLGSVLLGYQDARVDRAIIDQLTKGITASVPPVIEEEAGEVFCSITGHERVRFCKNGSDAVEAAIRLARHLTSRSMIITEGGYHGFHSDQLAGTPGRNNGIIELARYVRHAYSPSDLLSLIADEHPAAVLIEPVTLDGIDWPLAEIRDECTKTGTLLIFDEILSGFRYRLGSARPDVQADLYCWGKTIANGMPLACITGPAVLMQHFEHDVFFSSTAATEAVSLAAMQATVTTLQEQQHDLYPRLNLFSAMLREYSPFPTIGAGPRFRFQYQGEEQERAFLGFLALANHRLLFGRDVFLTAAHTQEHIDRAIAAFQEWRET